MITTTTTSLTPSTTTTAADNAAKCASLNQIAIGYYQAGNFTGAIDNLNQALSLLQSQIRLPQQQQQQQRQHQEEGAELSLPRYMCQPVTSVALSEATTSIFPFYARPFQLRLMHNDDDDMVDDDDSDEPSDEDYLLQFVVVTYNSALVHHAMAQQKVLGGMDHSHRALKLYGLAFQVMQEASWDCTSLPNQFLLLLAVCNNMAYLHSSSSHNFIALNDCLELFMELMEYCDGYEHQPSSSSDDDEDFQLLGPEDYLYFFTTSLLFQGRPLVLAPAA